MSNRVATIFVVLAISVLVIGITATVVLTLCLRGGADLPDVDTTESLSQSKTAELTSEPPLTTGTDTEYSDTETNASSKDTETTEDSDEITTAETEDTAETEKETEAAEVTETETDAVTTAPEPSPVNLQNPTDVDPSRPMIALTFDDGPGNYTERLLDILGTYNVRATFYVVGTQARRFESTILRESNEGHEIGVHTENHYYLTKLDYNGIISEIVPLRTWLYSVTGTLPMTVRPPYGKTNETVLAASTNEEFILVRWSVDSLDWKTKNADMIYDEIMNNVFDGSIILCHDIHKTTVDAMETVIPALLEKGYQFVTVSELLSFREGGVTTGVVYKKK
ncbi:MAG: polysaccharide deacetylase family protein [Firmicutes bacterium]|nr:polysaccharide deacetylase family protein [Bacillota bacterium]